MKKLSTAPLAAAATAARMAGGLSVAELSARSGVKQGTIYRVESGEGQLCFSAAAALAGALGLTIDEYTGHSTVTVVRTHLTAAAARGLSMKIARQAAGLTRSQLSELSGVSEQAIASMELGERDTLLRTVELCADALGLSLYMYTGLVSDLYGERGGTEAW